MLGGPGIPDDDSPNSEPFIDERPVSFECAGGGRGGAASIFSTTSATGGGNTQLRSKTSSCHRTKESASAALRARMPAHLRRWVAYLLYFDFVAAIRDPTHTEHNSNLQWVGGSFDPSAFDLVEVNDRLSVIKA